MSLMIVFHGIVAAPVHGRVRILVHFIKTRKFSVFF